MARTALVAAGGLAGSVARYWLGGAVQRYADYFPLGTLAVNVAGSFLLGLIMTLSIERGALGANTRLLLSVGFCGAFTTMSTFSYETLALLRDGEAALALANVGGTLAACCAAVWLGMAIARVI